MYMKKNTEASGSNPRIRPHSEDPYLVSDRKPPGSANTVTEHCPSSRITPQEVPKLLFIYLTSDTSGGVVRYMNNCISFHSATCESQYYHRRTTNQITGKIR